MINVLVCNVYQQGPAQSLAPLPDCIPSLCGIDRMLVSVERRLLRCGNYSEVDLRPTTGRLILTGMVDTLKKQKPKHFLASDSRNVHGLSR